MNHKPPTFIRRNPPPLPSQGSPQPPPLPEAPPPIPLNPKSGFPQDEHQKQLGRIVSAWLSGILLAAIILIGIFYGWTFFLIVQSIAFFYVIIWAISKHQELRKQFPKP
jgi:hypothetical protein